MAAPLASKITLPADTGNSGKNVRTVTKVIGADTVHVHHNIPDTDHTITGRYFFSSTQQSVQASAQDGTSTGFFWLQMPSAATVTAAIRFIGADFSASGTTAMPTAPTINFTKFTFTGTASGTSVAVLGSKTAEVANQLVVRSAVTGMTVTLVKDVGALQVPAIITGAGVYGGGKEIYNPIEQYRRGKCLEIAPGEGLVVYQAVAGTPSEVRKFGVQLWWDELDLS